MYYVWMFLWMNIGFRNYCYTKVYENVYYCSYMSIHIQIVWKKMFKLKYEHLAGSFQEKYTYNYDRKWLIFLLELKKTNLHRHIYKKKKHLKKNNEKYGKNKINWKKISIPLNWSLCIF